MKQELLTLARLTEMKPGEIIATGTTLNHPEGVYMTNNFIGRKLLWVAKRGYIHDWAVYCLWEDEANVQTVLARGDKITTQSYIRMLVPCDDEALAMYRR